MELRRCLQEASSYQMPSQLRLLFANILLYAECSNPSDLWEEFKEQLSEDLIRSCNDNHVGIVYTYRRINDILQRHTTTTPPYMPFSLETQFGIVGVGSRTLLLSNRIHLFVLYLFFYNNIFA